MDSAQVIDAQFNRAVEIVQSLPKTGPIQTDYEEKLTMYRCAESPFRLCVAQKVTHDTPQSVQARCSKVFCTC